MFPPKSPKTPRKKGKKNKQFNTRPKLRFGAEGSVQKPSALKQLFDNANASQDLSFLRRSASRTELTSRTGRNTQRVSVRKQKTLKRANTNTVGDHLKALNSPGKDQSFFELDPSTPQPNKPKHRRHGKQGSIGSGGSRSSQKRGIMGRMFNSLRNNTLSRSKRGEAKSGKGFASRSMLFRFAKEQKEARKLPDDYDASRVENQVAASALNLFAKADDLSPSQRKKFRLLKKPKQKHSFAEEEEEELDALMRIGASPANEASNFLPGFAFSGSNTSTDGSETVDDISLTTSVEENDVFEPKKHGRQAKAVSLTEFALEEDDGKSTLKTSKSETSTINTLSSSETLIKDINEVGEASAPTLEPKTSSVEVKSRKFSSKNNNFRQTEVSDSTSKKEEILDEEEDPDLEEIGELSESEDDDPGFKDIDIDEFDEMNQHLLDAEQKEVEHESVTTLNPTDFYLNPKKPSVETKASPSIDTTALINQEDESDLAYCRETGDITTRNVDTMDMTMNCAEDISLYETQNDFDTFHPQNARRDSATVYGLQTMKVSPNKKTTKHLKPRQWNYHYEKKNRDIKVLKLKPVIPKGDEESKTIRVLDILEVEADNLDDAIETEKSKRKKKANDKKVRFVSAVKSKKEEKENKDDIDSFPVRQRAAKSMSREEAADWAHRFIRHEAKKVTDPSAFFKIFRVIGSGSFGTVRKCRDLDTNQLIAAKICSFDSDKHLVGIATEIEIMKHLVDAPYAVRYYESLTTDEYKIWISMELCEAGDLATLLTVCKRTLDRSQIEPIVAAILLALEYLHGINIIHRDVKCANILLARNGVPKLSDFGVSRKVRNHELRAMSMAGSPYWMAPEVIKGRHVYNSKCDIWSLGISIYEMYYGDPPLTNLSPREAIKVIVTKKHAETVSLEDDADFNVALLCDELLIPDVAARKTASDLLTAGTISKVARDMRHLFDSKLLQSEGAGIQFGARRRGARANPFSVLKPVRELVEECLPTLEKNQKRRHKIKKKIKKKLDKV